ncbi:hypothetical protein CDAR_37741 [Caerostris darwini]|uniref:Uncharacterized protein n=1 Tax=Caerostris darwini TaxID=1538125 RepID=A0AAV4RCN7_9ARAC|nr:hypothetical protein CDAR_37741 [Caerostris darwini]
MSPSFGVIRTTNSILVRVTWVRKSCDKWMSAIWDLSPEQNVTGREAEILSKAESSGRLQSADCDQSAALDGSEKLLTPSFTLIEPAEPPLWTSPSAAIIGCRPNGEFNSRCTNKLNTKAAVKRVISIVPKSPLAELLTTSFTLIEPVEPPLWTSPSVTVIGYRPNGEFNTRVSYLVRESCDKWMSVIWDLSPEQNMTGVDVEILSKAESSGRLRSDDCDQSPALDGSERICPTDEWMDS